GINPVTKQFVDSLTWQWDGAPNDAAQRPRAIAFSNDGEYAYVATFSSGIMKRYKNVEHRNIGVAEEPNAPVVNGYSLSQNYPNPFNPSTVIKFHVAKEGLVSLKVYNTLGQEVAELVNEHMNAGDQIVNFNASHLSSGTYIYRLNVNGVSLTNKMVLIK
ncbi:MAG TPA: T9SS type A sorting domain-containing protein, partial [Ignavibacteriales bacterium]|nr:T9SS type A sorting domain-containing protein [Ignavibacteriales bacterium]